MKKPNFIFMMTDSQNAEMVGAYGRPEMRTPNLDKLAKEGVKFSRAHTTCPLCTPARAAIFSGIYSHTSGAWTNNLALGENIVTMGRRFSDLGYHAAYTGKWHLDGHDYFGTGICPDGWDTDYWYDGRNYLNELSSHEIDLWRRELNSPEALEENHISSEFTWAHRISDKGIKFLREQDAEEPFLLVLSYDEPHHPFTCPPEFVEPFKDFEYELGPSAFDDLKDKPAHHREWAEACSHIPQRRKGYYHNPLYFGCNSYVDYEMGRVLEAVERYAPENTYIIYTSDHGEMMGAHGIHVKGPVMYEEITHIPLIIKGPEIKPDSVNESLISHIDLLPSLLDLAGADAVPILEGNSFASLLSSGACDSERSLVMEFNRYEIEHDSWGGFKPIRSIMKDNYKLVINLLHTDEFYDLEKDPGEVKNLIDVPEFSSIRDAMHRDLLDWMYQKRDPFRGPEWERRPWQKQRTLKWNGMFRPRPADGYAKSVLDYDTGKPTKGVHVEHS